MGKTVVKDVRFSLWNNPFLGEVDVYENCSFNCNYLYFNDDVKKHITFKNCTFCACTSFNLVFFAGMVRFENCSFGDGTVFRGTIIKNGKIKFNKCEGLTEQMFRGLRNRSQTLREMGLVQAFKDYTLSTRKEETVYKKIGVYTLYDNGHGAQRICVGSAIATLMIPKGVVRYGDRKGKCRCERAMVTSIELYAFPKKLLKEIADHPSLYKYGSIKDNGYTIYEVGKEVKPNYFDYIPNKCSYGIHYFYDRKLAEQYDFS